MSHELDKIKNSKRRHKDETAVQRQVKIAKQHGVPVKQPHRLTKHHAMDCGDPGCVLCGNPRRNKTFKKNEQLTNQERKMFQDVDTVTDKHSNGLVPKDDDDSVK